MGHARQWGLSSLPYYMANYNSAMIQITKGYLESILSGYELAERFPVEMEVLWQGYRYSLPELGNLQQQAVLIGSTTTLMTRDSIETLIITSPETFPNNVTSVYSPDGSRSMGNALEGKVQWVKTP
ncbi:MAG: hypothetical protein AABX51_08455 [Nanoarchaeota archaeon]